MTDGAYPSWSISIKTIKTPLNDKEKQFSKSQEAVRKDVERVFSILKHKFQILGRPFRLWEISDIDRILTTCIIIHNMVVEDRIYHIDDDQHYKLQNNETILSIRSLPIEHNAPNDVRIFGLDFENIKNDITKKVVYMHSHITNTMDHNKLVMDLVEHIYLNKNKLYKYDK